MTRLTIIVELTAEQKAALTTLAAMSGEPLDAFVLRMTRKMLIGQADAAVREQMRASALAVERAYLAATSETRKVVLDALGLKDTGPIARDDDG